MAKAKISYTTNFKGKEGYIIEIDIGNGWETESFFPLIRKEGASEGDGADYVHFSFINKIASLKKFGYGIHWAL